MSDLFSPLQIRDVEFKNRVFVSPMCQYSAEDGMPNDWHFVHLGARAVGGAGLVILEATGVSPEGRITPHDLGIWSDAHAEAYSRITRFIKDQGAVPGVQLAHAGRKASTDAPWRGGKAVGENDGGWTPIAPSAIAFNEGFPLPREMDESDIQEVVEDFRAATRRSLAAGFEVVEVHMAHGYLLHQFLSPLSNLREDEYGGSLENRARLPLAVARAVREEWPENLPVFVRISATDWVDGGWSLEDSVWLSARLEELGIDLVDCSSGGLVPNASINVEPSYQVPFAEEVRREAGIATAAVGLITEPKQAEGIISNGRADAVLLARELLRDPHWPLRAAYELGADADWPVQYERAKPRH
ncbi:MAG: NADH:flavin oxidoreductase/NADH oxidase [Actinomycetota bacterium]|nr:NADH:flavin oxidoreductase/NADH oxidase [Actinomycetota bacterium]